MEFSNKTVFCNDRWQKYHKIHLVNEFLATILFSAGPNSQSPSTPSPYQEIKWVKWKNDVPLELAPFPNTHPQRLLGWFPRYWPALILKEMLKQWHFVKISCTCLNSGIIQETSGQNQIVKKLDINKNKWKPKQICTSFSVLQVFFFLGSILSIRNKLLKQTRFLSAVV